jgi:hexosaminidase
MGFGRHISTAMNTTIGLCFAGLLALVAWGGLSAAPAEAASHNTSKPLVGITLDCSNRYYSPSSIKKYIRLAQTSGHGYVQLHLTGDANVGIECATLGQKPSKKHRRGTRYYNPKAKRSFLTNKQVRQLIAYAKKHHVALVPEIDTPGHMNGFKKLYLKRYGKKKARKVFNAAYPNELAIKHTAARSFAKRLYREYAKTFKGCKYFHIGGDEFWSGSAKRNITYLNDTARYLQKRGFTVWCWNDLLTKTNYKKLNKKVRITYWSWDGDASSARERATRRKQRATFPQLQAAGFKLLNYNSYYLYYCPTKRSATRANERYMVNDARKHWNLRTWNSDSGNRTTSKKGIIGAAVSVWTEDAKGVSSKTLYRDTSALFKAMRTAVRA